MGQLKSNAADLSQRNDRSGSKDSIESILQRSAIKFKEDNHYKTAYTNEDHLLMLS